MDSHGSRMDFQWIFMVFHTFHIIFNVFSYIPENFKYIVNNNLTQEIVTKLQNTDAIVFWLSFFKPQKACAADEFFEVLRQLCEINKL